MACGVLLLDKPEGLSSNAALQRVRRLMGAGKAGHVGSLDPLATGMLPICLGEATKVAGELIGGRKRYRFTVALGARTSTADREGEIIERSAVPALTSQTVEQALTGFLGPQLQIPPMYSALKRGGQPLYRLARAGIEVERSARQVELFELVARSVQADRLELEVLCSKGTYVRTLAEDLARALGTCGHVSALRRLYVEPFGAERMIGLEEVASLCSSGRPPPLIAPDCILVQLEAVALSAAAAARLCQGQSVLVPGCPARGRVRLYDEAGRFLGLGEADGAGGVRPRRLFARP